MCQGLSWAGHRNYLAQSSEETLQGGGVYDSYFIDEETESCSRSLKEWMVEIWMQESPLVGSSLWSVCAAAFAWSSMCLLVYQINACLLCGKSSLKLIRFSQNPRMTQIPPSFFLLWEVFITLGSWPWYRVLNLWMSWVLLTSSEVHSPFSKQCIE